MKITKRFLQQKSACAEGIDWVVKNCKDGEAIDVIKALINYKLDWANWLIVRVMTRPQYLKYAIYSAEQVLHIYEKKYPNNKEPGLAIEAAKEVLRNDTAKNRELAKLARRYAAAAAAAAAYAAYADAAYAAAAYADAAAAKKQMQVKILNYGLSLLEEERN